MTRPYSKYNYQPKSNAREEMAYNKGLDDLVKTMKQKYSKHYISSDVDSVIMDMIKEAKKLRK